MLRIRNGVFHDWIPSLRSSKVLSSFNCTFTSPAEERRVNLLSAKVLHALFHLIAQWSGKFGKPFGAIDRRPSKDDTCSEMESSACQAMSALLCCGAVFDAQGIADSEHGSSYVFAWLDTLLKAHDTKVRAGDCIGSFRCNTLG